MELVPYQSSWQEQFRAERERLRTVFGSVALEIEHIGSTAIEGLLSKPIIDIAVMIGSHRAADGFTDALAEVSFESDPNNCSETGERLFYRKGDPVTCHLSVAFADQGGFWPRQILFRDYLRQHPESRDEYARLKADLLRPDPSGETYGKGKTNFIYEVLQLAGWRVGHLYRGPSLPEPETPPSVTAVVPREDYSLTVTFSSGEEGIFDVNRWVQHGPFHPQIQTHEDFSDVHVANGTIEWDCGVAMDPNYVYDRCTGAGQA